jgi:hypothetical protein
LKRPDTRYADGRQLGIVARDLGFRRVVYFLTYVKRNGFLNVISIRYAETSEEILFFVTTRDDTPPAPEKARRVVRVKQSPGEMPTDADAARALAWLARGKPQSEIVHDNGAPKQTKADLAKFRQASYRREKG